MSCEMWPEEVDDDAAVTAEGCILLHAILSIDPPLISGPDADETVDIQAARDLRARCQERGIYPDPMASFMFVAAGLEENLEMPFEQALEIAWKFTAVAAVGRL